MNLPAIALIIVGVILLISVVIHFTSSSRFHERTPNLGARTFLVLLRLAIGWHLLVEGMDKVNDPNWTSAGYLRQAVGPLAPEFRELAGTPVFDKLTLDPATVAKVGTSAVGLSGSRTGSGPVAAATALYSGAVSYPLPSALEREWQRYFDSFVRHYGLNEEQQKLARLRFDQARAETFAWLTTHTATVAIPEAATPIWMTTTEKKSAVKAKSQEMTIPEMMAYYRELLARLERIEKEELPAYGDKVHKRLTQTRTESLKIYGKLEKGLQAQTEQMEQMLFDTLDEEQQHMPPLAVPAAPVQEWSQLQWADTLVKYGLVIAGFCLLAGLLTRPAALLAAFLLLMFYLAMPPIPGWPENPRAEGHYIWINKNIIEMLALLTLAMVPSGRWLGLDGLLQSLWPRGRKRSTPHTRNPHAHGAEPAAQVLPATSTAQEI